MRFGNNMVFRRMASNTDYESYTSATIGGIAYKSILLIGIAIISALISMIIIARTIGTFFVFAYYIVPIVTLILSLVISFRPHSAKKLSIPFCILEGLTVGSVVGFLMHFETVYGLYAGLALLITLSYFLAASILLATNIIFISNKFKQFMFILGFGLLISMFFGGLFIAFVPPIRALIYNSYAIIIVISIITLVIAALYVFITIDNVFNIVEGGISDDYEWYAAFGITVNFIWLFTQVFRVIVLFAGRRD